MGPLAGARGVLFDLDGTLFDTRADIAAAANATRRQFGRAERPVEEIASFVGDGGRYLVSRVFDIAIDDPWLEALMPAFTEHYVANAYRHASWIPGARELLVELTGCVVGLVTNKARRVTEALLAEVDLPRPFDVVVAGGDGPLKPDPWSMHHASALLGVPCSELVLVGDGPQDLGAAHAAGVRCALYTGGFCAAEKVRALPAELVVDSMAELVPWARTLPRG
jgi:2-phosphoglycolate phosphatase